MQAAEQENAPHRSASIRNKISSPIELIHTTNMLSYNAPDIHPMSASSTGSSQRSDDDMSDSALTSGTTPPTSPDVESSPGKRALSPEPNHLSSFFASPGQPLTRTPGSQSGKLVAPQRAPSQPKKQYNTLVRQRSESGMSQKSHRTVSTKASFSFSRSSSSSTSTSVSSAGPTYHKSKLSTTAAAAAPTAMGSPAPAPFSPAAAPPPPRPQPVSQPPPPHQQQHRKEYSESQHPFGLELAQVSEIAEEYGVKEHLANQIDLEEQEMRAKGLLKFSADEYLSEVRGLFAGFMIPAPRPVAAAWI